MKNKLLLYVLLFFCFKNNTEVENTSINNTAENNIHNKIEEDIQKTIDIFTKKTKYLERLNICLQNKDFLSKVQNQYPNIFPSKVEIPKNDVLWTECKQIFSNDKFKL